LYGNRKSTGKKKAQKPAEKIKGGGAFPRLQHQKESAGVLSIAV